MTAPSSERHYPTRVDLDAWLPTSVKEVEARGWDELDVILVSGDAYVDHPAFGIAVIGRVLERAGYRVAILPQPNWRDDLRDFKKLGPPRLFFGVSAGNMDSMVNHYTANRRLRSNDAFTPGGRAGYRPDRALSVYAGILRVLYPQAIIIAGGIEASLRRLVHYDYWADAVHPGILYRSGIDYVVYGAGEKAILELARKIDRQAPVEEVRQTPQIAYAMPQDYPLPAWPDRETIALHSFAESKREKIHFSQDFKIIEQESNTLATARLTQSHGKMNIVVNPPHAPATMAEMDAWYDLPYTRLPHPRYWKKPLIPAFEMIRFSVTLHRGCFGGCAFCTISAHQGKHVCSRSPASVLREVEQIIAMPGFTGYLSDLGGPSANMYRMEPVKRSLCLTCRKPSCIHPLLCRNIDISHAPLLELYQKVRGVAGIKKAFIGSGIRYDLFLNERSAQDPSLPAYPRELIAHHVSGRLKVAPEHTRDAVLCVIRKPSFGKFLELKKIFARINEAAGLRQELIPYFISSHPGCTLEDMAELAAETRPMGLHLEQVQDFTPTPMTLASVLFHTGLDPYTLKPVYVAKKPEEKLLQRSFFFAAKPEEKQKVIRALRRMRREDLIPKIFASGRGRSSGKDPEPRQRSRKAPKA